MTTRRDIFEMVKAARAKRQEWERRKMELGDNNISAQIKGSFREDGQFVQCPSRRAICIRPTRGVNGLSSFFCGAGRRDYNC